MELKSDWSPLDFCEKETFLQGRVKPNSEKGEFELLLMFYEIKGVKTDFYRYWLHKMKEGEALPTPVFQKLVSMLGDSFSLKPTQKVLNIYETIQDKSNMKFDTITYFW